MPELKKLCFLIYDFCVAIHGVWVPASMLGMTGLECAAGFVISDRKRMDARIRATQAINVPDIFRNFRLPYGSCNEIRHLAINLEVSDCAFGLSNLRLVRY